MKYPQSHHVTYMKNAFEVAKMSKCVSFQVGAVVVLNKRPIVNGYNGTPEGFVNCCDKFANGFTREEHHEWATMYEIHAEMNAILYAAKENISLKDTTMYVTHHPCDNCIKHIVQAGIKKVYYYYDYDKRTLDNNLLQYIDIEKFPINLFEHE